MSEPTEPTVAQKLVGDFAPKLAQLTDDVLFGDVWERAELSPRDRSLVTVAALIANGNTDQLTGHLSRAKQKLILVASEAVFALFSPDEETFANALLWKNLLLRTCTTRLWEGERDGRRVAVWGGSGSPGDMV